MENNKKCVSVMYIDADIIFHKDVKILYEAFGDKDVGIFRHRFLKDDEESTYGKFNVGVVYFKNSTEGRHVLHWWSDAVLHKKYPLLATCGDQKYLDKFPSLCQNIFIDGNIGHGAPWNWSQYQFDNIHNHEIKFRGSTQALIFSHFSKFKFSFETNKFSEESYGSFTNNGEIYKNANLHKLHQEYFFNLKKADAFIKSGIKIAVGMIVFEGDYVLQECLTQIYPFVDQILIAEGPVKFWQDRGKFTSNDNTNKILDTFPDPDKKIKIVHGQFTEKLDESNTYMKYVNKDINYVWQIDSDEIYLKKDIITIKKMLFREQPTSVGVRSCSFYGGFDHYLTGFELNTDNFLRIFKYTPGTMWKDHRPPTMKYPNPLVKKHINSEELYTKYGVQMYHYSYVFPKQVKNKTNYYVTFTAGGTGNIPNYYENVYLKWVHGDDEAKRLLESEYCGVHEWKPERRGNCYTAKFNLTHPEAIVANLGDLKLRIKYELENGTDTLLPLKRNEKNEYLKRNESNDHLIKKVKTTALVSLGVLAVAVLCSLQFDMF
jgi:hypothetical protein